MKFPASFREPGSPRTPSFQLLKEGSRKPGRLLAVGEGSHGQLQPRFPSAFWDSASNPSPGCPPFLEHPFCLVSPKPAIFFYSRKAPTTDLDLLLASVSPGQSCAVSL